MGIGAVFLKYVYCKILPFIFVIIAKILVYKFHETLNSTQSDAHIEIFLPLFDIWGRFMGIFKRGEGSSYYGIGCAWVDTFVAPLKATE